MGRKRKIVLLIVSAIVAIGGYVGYTVLHIASQSVRDSYAVEWVAGMVIDHMKAHDGAWPASWEDLKDDYESATKEVGQPWTFEELRNRVDVDWSADPNKLLQATPREDGPPFHVIWLRDGSHVSWQGYEPNGMILRYLKASKRQGEKAGPP